MKKSNKPMFFRPKNDRDQANGELPKSHNNETEQRPDEDLTTIQDRIVAKYKQLTSQHLIKFHKNKLGVIISNIGEAESHLYSNASTVTSARYVEKELNDYMYANKLDIPPSQESQQADKQSQQQEEEQQQFGQATAQAEEEESETQPPQNKEMKKANMSIKDVNEGDEKQQLESIKSNMENFLDRLSIVELKVEEFGLRFDTVEDGINNIASKLYNVKEDVMRALTSFVDEQKNKGNTENSGGIGSEITIKYEDPLKQNKKMKGVFNKEFKKAIELCSSRINVLLTGESGCGKTHMASMLAEALSLRFGSQSCSEGMDESVFAGTLLPIADNGKFEYVQSMFVDFYENGGLFLIDEGDAADANLMIFINSALGNNHFHLTRRWQKPLVKRHKDFCCVMATNTIGHGGDDTYLRNQLDGATLDRFRAGIIRMTYSENVEKAIVDEEVYTWCKMIRDGITAMKMPRIMSTRVMLDFTKLKVQQSWKIKDMSDSYFMDWRKDDKARMDTYMKNEIKNLQDKVNSIKA